MLPKAVQKSLTGLDAVHTLDGVEHLHRKPTMLLATRDALDDLTSYTAMAWDEAVSRWRTADEVVLLDEIARVITEATCAWAGVHLHDEDRQVLPTHVAANDWPMAIGATSRRSSTSYVGTIPSRHTSAAVPSSTSTCPTLSYRVVTCS